MALLEFRYLPLETFAKTSKPLTSRVVRLIAGAAAFSPSVSKTRDSTGVTGRNSHAGRPHNFRETVILFKHRYLFATTRRRGVAHGTPSARQLVGPSPYFSAIGFPRKSILPKCTGVLKDSFPTHKNHVIYGTAIPIEYIEEHRRY